METQAELQKQKLKVPRHLGIILDGNRRFARRLMQQPWKGHEWGAKKIREFLEWCREFGVKEVTMYAFSLENFDRPKREFNYLMKIFQREFEAMVLEREKLAKEGVRIKFVGRVWMFPKGVFESMKRLEELTRSNRKWIVNFAMAYGGRGELVDATRQIAMLAKDGKLNPEEIDEKLFARHLYNDSELDLIIRTSGEQRTSGFLPWQGSYAELYFAKKCWPEFEKKDFIDALLDYSQRERRFGK